MNLQITCIFFFDPKKQFGTYPLEKKKEYSVRFQNIIYILFVFCYFI